MIASLKADKARKMVALWATTTDKLKTLSVQTGFTQIELADRAIQELAQRFQEEDEIVCP